MVFDTLSSLFGSVPSDVVVDSISSGIPSKLLGTSLAYSRRVPLLARASCHSRALFPMRLHFFQPITKLLADDSDYPDVTTADAGVFATANGFAAMALNRGKVKNFVLGTRKMYKGWAHGYLGAVRAVRREMVRTVAAGVKSTLGPSAVYACSMQVATSAMGLPSLVSVGAANVATPVIVSKLGGRLRKLSAHSLAARAVPIAAHYLIEWDLYDKIKRRMDGSEHTFIHPSLRPWVPTAHHRVTNALHGAVSGGVCAFGAVTIAAVALSPYYAHTLISRAVRCADVPTAARLGTAALRVTRIRLADSLQQGVVWWATYEAMRAATAKLDLDPGPNEDGEKRLTGEEGSVAGVPARMSRSSRGVPSPARVHTAYGVHLRTSRERRALSTAGRQPAYGVHRRRSLAAAC